MTPDEVVNNTLTNAQELGLIAIFHSDILSPEEKLALKSAITLLQDYQKLRERVNVEKIAEWYYTQELCFDLNTKTEHAIQWGASQRLANHFINSYLQQPTEH